MSPQGDPGACPSPDVLYLFVEGQTGERAIDVARHLGTCPDCRFIVRETRAFLDQEAEGNEIPTSAGAGIWWLAAAAAMIIAVAALQIIRSPDPAIRFDRALARSGVRPVEGRLSGMKYKPFVARRGDTDPIPPTIHAMADAVVRDTRPANAREWHRRGVALLVKGNAKAAGAAFARATELAPDQPRYWSDLAAARIASGVADADPLVLAAATVDASRALRLSPNMPEARFNLALALERRGLEKEAFLAYRAYVALDDRSAWNDEARLRLENHR